MDKIENNILQNASKNLKYFMNISYCNKKIGNITKYIEHSLQLSDKEIDTIYLKIYGHLPEINTKQKITDIAKFYVNIIHLYASISISVRKLKELYDTLIDDLNLDIKGLDELYYTGYNIKDDIFDHILELKDEFDFDLKSFYKKLTGKNPPENIQSFGDIDFKKVEFKMKHDIEPKKIFSKKNNYTKYANKVNITINIILRSYDILQEMENELFIYDKDLDHKTIETSVKLNPKLNSEKLSQLIIDVRNEIIQFYTTYESEYAEVMKIYQQILEEQMKNVLELQIEIMENLLDEIIYE